MTTLVVGGLQELHLLAAGSFSESRQKVDSNSRRQAEIRPAIIAENTASSSRIRGSSSMVEWELPKL
jgi:hypothetical protein